MCMYHVNCTHKKQTMNIISTTGDITGHVQQIGRVTIPSIGNKISVVFSNNKILVNNREVPHSGNVKIFVEYVDHDTKEVVRDEIPIVDNQNVHVTVQGDAGNVTVSNGKVIVHGNANQVNNTNGKVKVGQDVLGNCQTSNGEIYARNVNGNVTTSNADIYIEGEARGLKRTSNGRVVRQ